MERVAGIEPAHSAWEADKLPLHHTRRRGDKVTSSQSVFIVEIDGIRDTQFDPGAFIKSRKKNSSRFPIDIRESIAISGVR